MTIAIYGPGGFGRELLPLHDQAVFISDSPAEIGREIGGARTYSLAGFVEAEEDRRRAFVPTEHTPFRPTPVVIAVADAATRRTMADRVAAAGLRAGRYMGSEVVIGRGVEIGEGAILCHHTVLTASCKIGRHFHANLFSYVAHDCVIGDFVTLAPRVGINGNTIVGDGAYIGTGAILKHGTPAKPLIIGEGAVVGMGAVVTRDVPPYTTVVGNPARAMEQRVLAAVG